MLAVYLVKGAPDELVLNELVLMTRRCMVNVGSAWLKKDLNRRNRKGGNPRRTFAHGDRFAGTGKVMLGAVSRQ